MKQAGGVPLGGAQEFLRQLGKRLDEPISWEQKRRLIEALVGGIRVDKVETRPTSRCRHCWRKLTVRLVRCGFRPNQRRWETI